MFLLVPAHPGCPGQFPQSRKTVVCVCVCVYSLLSLFTFLVPAYPGSTRKKVIKRDIVVVSSCNNCLLKKWTYSLYTSCPTSVPSDFDRASATHTHIQPFYGSVEFVRDNPGEPVPEETLPHYCSPSSGFIGAK